MPKGRKREAFKPRGMAKHTQLKRAELSEAQMNRAQRRAMKSSKQQRYAGLSRPTRSNGLPNQNKKGKAGY